MLDEVKCNVSCIRKQFLLPILLQPKRNELGRENCKSTVTAVVEKYVVKVEQ